MDERQWCEWRDWFRRQAVQDGHDPALIEEIIADMESLRA